MSRDGRWFATDQGDDDVYIFERKPYVYQGEPDGETLGFYFAATCETSPIALDFSEDGQSLLIVQDDGAIVIVDLAAKSCRTIAPFGEADDTGEGRAVVDATWLNGRNQAMARLDAPAPGVALIDLEGRRRRPAGMAADRGADRTAADRPDGRLRSGDRAGPSYPRRALA